jgi:hypothetical protein
MRGGQRITAGRDRLPALPGFFEIRTLLADGAESSVADEDYDRICAMSRIQKVILQILSFCRKFISENPF